VVTLAEVSSLTAPVEEGDEEEVATIVALVVVGGYITVSPVTT
jgi:hypothetical protein